MINIFTLPFVVNEMRDKVVEPASRLPTRFLASTQVYVMGALPSLMPYSPLGGGLSPTLKNYPLEMASPLTLKTPAREASLCVS